MVNERLAQNGNTRTLISISSSQNLVPQELAVDGGGNLYIANLATISNYWTLVKWSAANGSQTILMPSASIPETVIDNGISGVALDSARDIYILNETGNI